MSVSNLTPDGDLFSDARVAIRTFISKNPMGLSEREQSVLQDWAIDCTDPANSVRLMRLAHILSAAR